MAKKPAKTVIIRNQRAAPSPLRKSSAPGRKPRATWPYVLLMLGGWGVILGGIFFSHYLSGLPDVRNLMISGPSQDITILDVHKRLIARRGLIQGRIVRAEEPGEFATGVLDEFGECSQPGQDDQVAAVDLAPEIIAGKIAVPSE